MTLEDFVDDAALSDLGPKKKIVLIHLQFECNH
jgi:hypothetical protein